MYNPPHFTRTDPAALHRLLREHPLGTLVHTGPGGLDADHLPFEFDPDGAPTDGTDPAAAPGLGVLWAHVARANPLWQRLAGAGEAGAEVLVVFHGPQAYVSPNWSPSKHASHRQVPTWNYEVVHAHGRLRVRDDERFVRGVVARLTRRHEAEAAAALEARAPEDAPPPHRPWKMSDSDPAFITELLGRIVGLEIVITRLEGKAKLSQNRDAADRQGAADTLAHLGHGPLAQAMREASPPGA